jgi:hypothetical protein
MEAALDDARERRIRPVLWALFGALTVPIALLIGLDAAAAATRVGAVQSAPRCTTAFAKGCTTERAGVLDAQGYPRGSWMTREQRWYVRVAGGVPGRHGGDVLAVTVPRQRGREGLVKGAEVTVVFYGRAPAWIRLRSGVVLETEDHPRRKAPLYGWLALGALGGGIFGMRTGIRGRRQGGWLRRTSVRVRRGPEAVLFVAGMAGALVQQFAGGTVWPGVAAGLLAAGAAILAWRPHRRQTAPA